MVHTHLLKNRSPSGVDVVKCISKMEKNVSWQKIDFFVTRITSLKLAHNFINVAVGA